MAAMACATSAGANEAALLTKSAPSQLSSSASSYSFASASNWRRQALHSSAPESRTTLTAAAAAASNRQLAVSAAVSSSAENVKWEKKREALLEKKVQSFSPKKALELVEKEGYTILDVRVLQEFEEVRAEGSKNAQIYRLIKEWTAWDILRRAGFAFFGVFNGTEENPEFLNDVAATGLTKDSKIITACAFGGTLKPSQNFPIGRESRSLIAAYVLTQNGYTNVNHLEGGLSTYFREELPVEFKED